MEGLEQPLFLMLVYEGAVSDPIYSLQKLPVLRIKA